MKRWRPWLLNAVLLTMSLVLALGVTEVALRVASPQPTGLSHQDRYGLALHYPGITRYLPQHGHEVSFNSVGMRDVEHTVERPEGTHRILVLGDSFMEGFQVPFEKTMSHRVERILRERTSRSVEVLNAGVSGWGTDDELRYLIDYGTAYDPEVVLVAMTLHNDLIDNLRQEWHTLVDGELIEQPRERMSFLQFKVVQFKAFVATHFQIYQLYRTVRHRGEIQEAGQQLQSHVVDLFRAETPEYLEYGYALVEQLLEELRSRTSERGARLVLVLVPLEVQVSTSRFENMAQAAGLGEPELVPDKPQRYLLEIAARLQIPVIDLLPGLQDWAAANDESLYVVGDGHWNDAGHRLASEIVADQLVAWGVAP